MIVRLIPSTATRSKLEQLLKTDSNLPKAERSLPARQWTHRGLLAVECERESMERDQVETWEESIELDQLPFWLLAVEIKASRK